MPAILEVHQLVKNFGRVGQAGAFPHNAVSGCRIVDILGHEPRRPLAKLASEDLLLRLPRRYGTLSQCYCPEGPSDSLPVWRLPKVYNPSPVLGTLDMVALLAYLRPMCFRCVSHIAPLPSCLGSVTTWHEDGTNTSNFFGFRLDGSRKVLFCNKLPR